MNGFRPLHLFLGLALAMLLWAAHHTLGPLALLLAAWLLNRPLVREEEGRTLQSLFLLLILLWILYQARWVVYPLACGALLAHVLVSPVAWLEARRVRRPLATLLALLPLGLFGVLALFLLVPALTRQVQLLIAKLPQGYEVLQRWSAPLLKYMGKASVPAVPLPDAGGAIVPAPEGLGGTAHLPPWLAQLVQHAESYLGTAAKGIVGMGKGLGKVFQVFAVLALTPLIAYYLTLDWHRVGAWIDGWLPSNRREPARRLSLAVRNSLLIYVRGQVLVALIEMVLFSMLFLLAGLPQPVALGLLGGMLTLIPVLGFWTTMLLVILASVTGPTPGSSLLISGCGLLVINVIEGQVLTPRIQGTGLGLHPLAVLLGVLFFGTLFGVVGVLLSVPALAVIQTLLGDRPAGIHRVSVKPDHRPSDGPPSHT